MPHKKFFNLPPPSPSSQTGFTLMEILVATTIFATVLTIMLVLFNYTLKINRRVEQLRQLSQGTRNFEEYLVREIRNGRIDYGSANSNCAAVSYASASNSSLALINRAGERECFYKSGSDLLIGKQGITDKLNPQNVTLGSVKFYVRPTSDPAANGPPFPGTQPVVTILMQFKIQLSGADPLATIPYQTTISTDIYDVPHK